MKYLMAVIVVASLIRLGRCQELPPAPSSANTWLVGTHPTFGRLEAKDFLQLGIATSPSVLAYVFHHEGLFLAGLVGPTVLGVKHIQAGRQWQALLDGQPPTESERY